ncbi:MAG: helix-turn-helix domain-containing protein [Theionarchaea archaeon]|nr:helix-turn-helix domain-containing protein [Theionarchaea archaeon]MBU7038834.1 helix-turn-helix domain-containing protein [Theionarchaea archaeon]
MIEVELSVSIQGNYGCDITNRHQDLILEVVSGYNEEGTVSGLLKTNYPPEELQNLREEFLTFPYVKEYEVLESGYVRIAVDSSDFPLSQLIHTAGAFYIYPIRFQKGRELCTLIFENKKRLQSVLQHLEDWKIIRIGNVNLQFDLEDLTPQQLKAVNLAIERGYFEIPKKVNLEELSTQMKLSRTTFLEHLRKAEKKILSRYFEMD